MFVGRGAGRWVEASLVGNSCPHCLGYSVVDFKDNPFGAIFAVFSLILALHDGEGVHDVVHDVASSGSGLGNFVIFKRICLRSRKFSTLNLFFCPNQPIKPSMVQSEK